MASTRAARAAGSPSTLSCGPSRAVCSLAVPCVRPSAVQRRREHTLRIGEPCGGNRPVRPAPARRSITLNFRLTVGRGRCKTPALVRLRRLCALLSVVALPLLAWALLPVVSTGADSASIQRRIDRDNAAIDTQEAPRGRADDRHHGVQPAHRLAAGEHLQAAGARGPDPGRPRRQARRAGAHPGAAADRARPARAAQGAARLRRGGARRGACARSTRPTRPTSSP